MDENRLFALANCFGCGNGFSFDPERVTTIMIDPVTSKPPDLGEDDIAEATKRSNPEPLCPSCVTVINRLRIEQGLAPVRELH